ncbi:hypothetical protein [Novilysobacter spongiicola]|uniref:Transmembrane protein n=1 Tax=Lysobacter spongiicola DSM 21749 TaxID=1122188 RepID=A0A1T4SEX9_9GAMM|nr:hypothetical protein [Lysobacter spongiicola]SKA26729.1 hypothetical protein SAMN02745674_02799 [Lysobacter spongiicola DSM 21749]
MKKATGVMLVLAAVSALLAGASLWWWIQLMQADLPACMAEATPIGVDCTHAPQLLAALVFTVLCLSLLLALFIRHVRVRMARMREENRL